MAWVVGGAIVGGAALNYLGSQRAAGAQADAANRATDTQWAMYNQSRADNAPWRTMGTDVGVPGMTRLMTDPGSFTGSPGYQFRFDQGMRALTNSQAARGGLLSGGAMKEATSYGQGIGSDEYMNEFNRYATMSGMGQTAVNNTTNAGVATAGNVGNSTMAAGNARASGYIGGANAITGGLNSGINYYQNQQLMSQLFGQPYYSTDYSSPFTHTPTG